MLDDLRYIFDTNEVAALILLDLLAVFDMFNQHTTNET